MTEQQSEGWWRDHASMQGQGCRARSSARRQREEWESRARTPQTRADIRRWARWEAVGLWLLLGSMFCVLIAAPILGIGFGVWGAFDSGAPSWMWGLFGSAGLGIAMMTAGAILSSHAKERRMTALYADGQVSVGRLHEVFTHPGGGEDQTTYEFLILAELPDEETHTGAILRRRLYWGEDDSWGQGPERWIGRSIRFRHNTLDPDALYDVRFDGWADRAGPR
ncbi:hypothetical protein QF046_001087 [Microbacterium sp. W4I4]|uniref:hypothetical protein n=1 Tax=Microbacterium sp. W4I4 TaxID=3042295 RepID=UPI00278969B3|nr:hypothetical protein [Microbacterium sp. W4I4]MDQ0613446.1 hypothetical protein [Microbacterium sp. W4I4]